MLRERIAEDVSFFSSDIYAQVCAGVIHTSEGAILIDTLAVPSETKEVKEFIEQKLGSRIRYIINTHYHADHTGGNFLFPDATIISSILCRKLMDSLGREAFRNVRSESREMASVEIRLPNLTIEQGAISFLVGKRTIRILPLPGHTPDGIGVLLEEERILFAGDAVMPLPYIRDGNIGELTATLKMIASMGLENIIQGHGDVILRGEIDDTISSHISYLDKLQREVQNACKHNWSDEELRQITIEKCGKSRILLNGIASELHWRNLVALKREIQKSSKGRENKAISKKPNKSAKSVIKKKVAINKSRK